MPAAPAINSRSERRCFAALLALLASGASCSADERAPGFATAATLPVPDPGVLGAAGSLALPATGSGAVSGASPSGTRSDDPTSACASAGGAMGRAPLRRLTRFEYNNSVRDLLGDTTSPARAFPAEELGNGFGNDADAQSVSSLLAEQYATVAEDVARRATQTPEALARLHPCASAPTAAQEPACAQTVIDSLGPRAYRRAMTADERADLVALYGSARASVGFGESLGVVIEALLQLPEFLYRIEIGTPDAAKPGRRRLTGDEMASRLSFFFWGTLPDDALKTAAASGELSTPDGVLAQARRMLEDPRSRTMLRFFFDNLLPIASLSQLERDPALYPQWSAQIGELLREETHTFLEHEIFSGSGTWPGMLTAPYTFVNDALAAYYGMPPVTGAAFQKVSLEPGQRLGLLTQGGVMAGSTTSNLTNPVLRGAFVARQLMCRPLALPTDPAVLAKVKPPEPYTGKTARERYGAHSADPVCRSCHQFMDPIGLTFENFDAVGRYRTTENGVTIDPSGQLPGTPDPVQNAVGLVQTLAAQAETQACFASHWLEYAYGRTLRAADPADACLKERIQHAFTASGHGIEQLLLDLTQTDEFLYLPGS